MHSGSAISERRQHQRQQDRRNLTVLRVQVRYDRRLHDRRDLFAFHKQARNSHIESVNARFDSVCSLTEFDGSLCLWVVTERVDLISRLQAYSERLSAISIHPYSSNQLKGRYDELGDSSQDLVLIDTALSDAVIIDQMQEIRRSPALVKIILLYDRTLPDLVKEIVEYSVSGLLLTGINQELFLKAIHAVHKGEYWFPRQLINRILVFLNSQQNHSAIAIGNNHSQGITALTQIGVSD